MQYMPSNRINKQTVDLNKQRYQIERRFVSIMMLDRLYFKVNIYEISNTRLFLYRPKVKVSHMSLNMLRTTKNRPVTRNNRLAVRQL